MSNLSEPVCTADFSGGARCFLELHTRLEYTVTTEQCVVKESHFWVPLGTVILVGGHVRDARSPVLTLTGCLSPTGTLSHTESLSGTPLVPESRAHLKWLSRNGPLTPS